MAGGRYILDAKASQFTLQAFAEGLAGIADHRPRFAVREFSGELEFSPNQLNGGSVQLKAYARSLDIMDDVSQNDRAVIERVMFNEVLHPETFPEVAFRSSKVACNLVSENRYSAEIVGSLALHGTENLQTMQAQLIVSSGSLRAYGEFRLRQSDYGLTIASVAGGECSGSGTRLSSYFLLWLASLKRGRPRLRRKNGGRSESFYHGIGRRRNDCEDRLRD